MRKQKKIFYYCYDHNRPGGGQKHTYEHVDILNDHGFEAYIVHGRTGFRLTWFNNDTPVLDYRQFASVFNSSSDFVVLPEDLGIKINRFPGKKVIFNKNIFYGFGALGFQSPGINPYLQKDVVAAFAVSDHNAAQLRFAFPELTVLPVHPAVRSEVFQFADLFYKRRQIAYVAKNSNSLAAAYQMFSARAASGHNAGQGWNWILISNKTEAEVAEVLRESFLTVFTSAEEGLGRIPLEAMACGCLVAAFDVGPLRETLPSRYLAPYGDICSLVRWIEEAVACYPVRLSLLQPLVQRGRDMAARYLPRLQQRSVCAAWNKIMDLPNAHAPGKSLLEAMRAYPCDARSEFGGAILDNVVRVRK